MSVSCRGCLTGILWWEIQISLTPLPTNRVWGNPHSVPQNVPLFVPYSVPQF
jgi:hypothetical protein